MTCSIETCGPIIARGMCSKHYQRWRNAHRQDVMPSLRGIPAIDRLLGQCVEVEGCWLYQGGLDHAGYARLRGDNSRKVYGHRLAWEFFIGPFPPELTFDHLCRRKNCVNPWHGEPVPSYVNTARAPQNIGVINAAKTHCPQGHPLDGTNLRFATRGKGRVCRACRAKSSREYRVRLKEIAS